MPQASPPFSAPITIAHCVTGFIGFPVATAYARAGHIVYGVTRSKSNGQLLAKEEIIPVVCDSGTDAGRGVWGEIAAVADVGKCPMLERAGVFALTGRK